MALFHESLKEDFPNIQSEYFVSDIILRSSDDAIVLYVPNDRLSETIKPGFVSKKQLENLTKKIS